MDINNLINFIKNNPPARERWEKSLWEKNLAANCPGWESLVKDSKNWQSLEYAEPLTSHYPLCCALFEIAGIQLAISWFNSSQKDQKRWARDYINCHLYDHLYDELTIDIWKAITDEIIKEYIITCTFDKFPGEPFKSFEKFINCGFRDALTLFPIPLMPTFSYIPSGNILFLRSIIKNAGDKDFLKFVDKMIKERKDACEKIHSLRYSPRIPYILTEDERELIARAMDKFRENGYMLSAPPQIYLSMETPPLFIAYPELEEELEEGSRDKRPMQRESEIKRKERGRPETICIEELLGCYLPNSPTIILYKKGLSWCARKYNLDEKFLRGIVLIHEVGHWITHLLPKPNAPLWPTEIYKCVSTEVHEGWAQLITYWVVEEVGKKIKQIFEELNKHQPPLYSTYKEFKKEPVTSMINSLEGLRQLHCPAGIDDWKRLIK